MKLDTEDCLNGYIFELYESHKAIWQLKLSEKWITDRIDFYVRFQFNLSENDP